MRQSKGEPVTITDDQGKVRTAGYWNEDTNTFTKRIVGSKHIHRKTNSIGINAAVYDMYIQPKQAMIIVEDVENRRTYRASESQFDAHKFTMNFGDKQYFLPLKYWDVTEVGQRSLLEAVAV